MKRPLFVLLLAGSLLPAAAIAEDNATGGRHFGALRFEPCSLRAPGQSTAVAAQCTSIEVLENRADPGSRKIELALAWVPASGDAEPDPIFLLAGGPGQAAKQAYPGIASAFRDVRRSRDVLLLDARGTGDSHPLVCRNAEGEAAIGYEEAGSNIDSARDFAKACAEVLSKDSDLRFYGTSEHIDDLEQVRGLLGAEQINLIGVSYGTRVAQQYAKRYPQHLRALVLDSVAPNSLVLGNEHASNLESALNIQFERCRQIPACAKHMGDPRQNLDKVRRRLNEGELPLVRFRDATSGEWQEAKPSFGHLALLLRMYAYAPESAATLPLLLDEAANGRYEAMLAQANSLGRNLSEQIFHGMQLSVMCSEDVDEFDARLSDSASVMGSELIDYTQAQCSVWPRGSRDPAFREPLSADIPTLLLSGEYDPVTPPRYADEVASHLPRARHLVLKGQGHSVVGLGCAPQLFALFLESADAVALDASCLDRLLPLPPFAGVYGWEP